MIAAFAASDAQALPLHVLVCVSGAEGDLLLVRSGDMLARRLAGRLSVLYVFVPGNDGRGRQLIDRARVAAKAAGATLVELPAYGHVDGIAEYVNSRGVSHVVVADGSRNRWTPWRESLSCRLAERLPNIDLLVINRGRIRADFVTNT